MALVNAASIALSNGNGEILEDVEFRTPETNTPLEVMYVYNLDFWGVLPIPNAHIKGRRLLLKMSKVKCQIFQWKLTNSRQYGIL